MEDMIKNMEIQIAKIREVETSFRELVPVIKNSKSIDEEMVKKTYEVFSTMCELHDTTLDFIFSIRDKS